jgi:peptidoglycan/LPS O-acetylase OafA/YrhL
MLPAREDPGQARSSRVAALDALRAVAALLVVWTHVCEDFVKLPYPAAHGGSLHDAAWSFDFGRAGVVAFFATSGFLIPSGLREDSTSAIRRFAVRRFFRLYPAYWVSLVAGWLVLFQLRARPLPLRALLANVTMAPGALGEVRVLGLYWTLETELLFYALCVLAHLAGVLSSARWLFGIAGTFLLGFLAFFAQNYLALPLGLGLSHDQGLLCAHLGIMFGAALLRRVHERSTEGRGPRAGVALLGTALLVGFVLPGLYLGYGPRHDAWLVRFSAPYGIGVALFAAAIAWRFGVPSALRRIGEASYSLYLFHPAVLGLALWWVHGPSGARLRELHLSAYLVVVAGASVAVAMLAHRFVEQPAMRIGDRRSRTIS